MTEASYFSKSKYKVITTLILLAAPLAAQPQNTTGKQLQKTVKISSSIQVGFELGIPGASLCHDGQYLYFKNRSACESLNRIQKSSGLNHISQPFDCSGPMTITAINEIEEIFIPEFPERSILRFFSVDLTYTEKTFSKEDDGRLPPRFKLLRERTKKVSQCSSRPKLPTTNVYSQREANKIQKYLILSLLKNGINVLNSPHGTLNAFASHHSTTAFGLYDHKFSQPISSSLLSTSPVLQLQTPYCNPSVTEEIITQLIGGESSGGGYRTFKTKKLQSLSSALEVRSTLSKEEWSKILKKPLRLDLQAFEVQCLPSSLQMPNLAGGAQ